MSSEISDTETTPEQELPSLESAKETQRAALTEELEGVVPAGQKEELVVAAVEEEPADVIMEKMKAAEAEANSLVKENHELRIERNKAQRKLGMPTKQKISFEDEDGAAPKE